MYVLVPNGTLPIVPIPLPKSRDEKDISTDGVIYEWCNVGLHVKVGNYSRPIAGFNVSYDKEKGVIIQLLKPHIGLATLPLVTIFITVYKVRKDGIILISTDKLEVDHNDYLIPDAEKMTINSGWTGRQWKLVRIEGG
jgi:hypothetical protein